jgi:DNA-binding response OmpR family regulator
LNSLSETALEALAVKSTEPAGAWVKHPIAPGWFFCLSYHAMKDNQVLPACESARERGLSRTNSPCHILMVEDDDFLRDLSTEALIHSGYEVDAAADGAAAWQALNNDSYDLLITDNNMPKISGVQLLKKLRAVHMELPVIMATGTIPQEEFARYPWLQPAATLLKPFAIEEMLQTVKQVLLKSESAPTAPRPRPTRSAYRILAVDKDHDLRLLYAEALAGSDYDVHLAEDGSAAWEALQANSYHLLITEHDLPNLTGVALVAKLRAARMALPVVMAAARLPAHELARDPALQLAATLMKPFAIDVLLDTVKSVLRATISLRAQIAPPNWQSQPVAAGLRL